jgi:hypothetical protein
MRRFTPHLVCLGILLSQAMHGADQQRSSVVDYFLLLPTDTFEGSPAEWLKFMSESGGGVVDKANGYLSCTGDGAQPAFQVALFRFNDGRPLLAVCSGELEGPDSVFLDFFELGTDGRIHKVSRGVFPIRDGNGRKFILPQKGRTVVVTDGKSGKILRRVEWDGTKFQPEG